jgi:competence protein ComEC
VLVRTATRSLLYDAGPRYNPESDAGVRVLVPLLRALGERLDTVVLSHRDSDHTGGAAAVLASQPRAALLASIEDGHPLQALRPARRCVAGQRWSWDGVDFEVLHPLEHDHDAPGAKPNALSCVLRIGNGRAAALLAGDIERAQEAALVGRAVEGALRADVLLVPQGDNTIGRKYSVNIVTLWNTRVVMVVRRFFEARACKTKYVRVRLVLSSHRHSHLNQTQSQT